MSEDINILKDKHSALCTKEVRLSCFFHFLNKDLVEYMEHVVTNGLLCKKPCKAVNNCHNEHRKYPLHIHEVFCLQLGLCILYASAKCVCRCV